VRQQLAQKDIPLPFLISGLHTFGFGECPGYGAITTPFNHLGHTRISVNPDLDLNLWQPMGASSVRGNKQCTGVFGDLCNLGADTRTRPISVLQGKFGAQGTAIGDNTMQTLVVELAFFMQAG
jgi:hypothetical protein